MRIHRLIVENFRSIEHADLELAPLTILYGPNGAGKSSLLYAPLGLRNIAMSPNAPPSAFWNYGFVSLGGFREVVFGHTPGREIAIGVMVSVPEDALIRGKSPQALGYRVRLQEERGWLELLIGSREAMETLAALEVTFPYSGTQSVEIPEVDPGIEAAWNGFVVQVKARDATSAQRAQAIARALNAPIEALRRIRFVPLRRGFSQPIYTPVPITPLPLTEGEIATLLAQDRDLEYRVERYLEQIANRNFRVRPQLGTAVFELIAGDRETGLGVSLVNEGFGINQLIYLLAQALSGDAEWILIEEPEIHLHPSSVRRLARALSQIASRHHKQFLISTHSEAFLIALLAQVAQGTLRPADLACYFVERKDGVSLFTRQAVTEEGQIEGGMRSFIEGELEDLREFLGLEEEPEGTPG
ncbi:AAA family ATPase [Thermoflexus sp.]|uniref:AAA family ATPase n=1 Tax=Thermoflexus sp. TaxID=1969742 RepID=UPI001774CD9F|nr:AAA family ATPase [Thermoflexus sp.]